jgi:hypothetical protein
MTASVSGSFKSSRMQSVNAVSQKKLRLKCHGASGLASLHNDCWSSNKLQVPADLYLVTAKRLRQPISIIGLQWQNYKSYEKKIEEPQIANGSHVQPGFWTHMSVPYYYYYANLRSLDCLML